MATNLIKATQRCNGGMRAVIHAKRWLQDVGLTPELARAHHFDIVMAETPLRIGILGAAGIVKKKNWNAIQCSGTATVAAIATRDLERTRQFIAERQAEAPFPVPPRAHASYEALLADKDIEAVYIPLPTGLRKAWVIQAANAGKHVVCEKPCAVSSVELSEMLAACRRNRVQFMDGVMFDHNPRLARLREILDDVKLGPVRRITSEFSFLGTGDFHERNIRIQGELEPLGCLGDLGWYCIRFSLWVMRWALPTRVAGRVLQCAANGVPTDFSGELWFEGGVSAGFHCSFLLQGQQWANVSGAQASLRVPDFVLPNSDNAVAWEVNYQPVPKSDVGIYLNTATTPEAQEALMFRNFASQVRSGKLNEDWMERVLKTQQVVDACLASARAGGGWTNVAV